MELLDLYNENGEKLNKTIQRGNKNLADNEFIKLTILWIKCKDKYLLQKTSEEKGGDYAVTGGHVPAGSDSLNHIIVEAKEELGLNLTTDKIKLLGSLILKRGIFDVYLFEDEMRDKVNFTLQTSEVEHVKWFTKEEIEEYIQKGLIRKSSIEQYNKFIK